MRKHVRGSIPNVLKEKASQWNEQWANLKTNNPSASFNWYQHKKKSVRDWIIGDLKAITQGHCAFCDRFTVEPDSVEHFKPKSDPRFLHLAYEWTNLFYCCGGCQTNKLEKWDDKLINPDDDDYQFARFFVYDFTTGAIEPNPKASPSERERARVTIEIYGLDSPKRRRFRSMELRRWRLSSDKQIDQFAYRDFVDPGLV